MTKAWKKGNDTLNLCKYIPASKVCGNADLIQFNDFYQASNMYFVSCQVTTQKSATNKNIDAQVTKCVEHSNKLNIKLFQSIQKYNMIGFVHNKKMNLHYYLV